jgi:hypothetical protein
MTSLQHSGRVTVQRVASGSKSERDAVVLDTDGHNYILRRQGGNPFRDPALERLVGKTVAVTGKVTGNTLIMSDWQELPEDEG